MNGSLRLATVAGIGIFVHWTFSLLLLWIALVYFFQGGSVLMALQGIALILALFGCVVLHELGHALTARRFGIPTRDITLLPIGGVARLERMPEKPMQEFLVAIAGPLVNVALATVFFFIVLGTQGLEAIGALFESRGEGERNPVLQAGGMFFMKLMWINVAIFLFNMLPAFPMDGGRILRSILSTTMSRVQATTIAARVGQAMAILFGVVGLFTNPFLVFIAIFVFLGAQGEANMVGTESMLRGVRVRDALMTEFATLHADDRLDKAIDEVLAGSQREFPVIDGRNIVGMLSVSDLLRALASGGPDQSVADIVNDECRTVTPDEDLAEVMAWMREAQCQAAPVTRNGELVGLLTLENVMEWMRIRQALHGAAVMRA